MPRKNQTCANPEQMSSPEGSNPPPSLDIVELTPSLQATQPPRRASSSHKRSSSDSLVTLKKPDLVGQRGYLPGSNGAEGNSKLIGDGKAVDPNTKSSEGSSSSLVTETQQWSRSYETNVDPKKMKRLIANRVSAQKSRMRKMEYIEKLKRDIEIEEAKIDILAPQVAFYARRREMLQKENEEIKQKIAAIEKEEARRDAEYQALKNERDMLSLLYFLQKEGL